MANVVANPEKQHKLENSLTESWPSSEWRDCHVVLGVSGGPDSVAMLRVMDSLKQAAGGRGQLFVAHLNHAIRGQAADEDAAWLKTLCERIGLGLVVEKIDIGQLADEQGDGWEAAARTARYAFLRRTAEQIGARFVVTAHTADDQVETILHRILRGTGIEGLAGMPKVRPLSECVVLVRPLLTASRRDVLEYLAAIGQDYRTDETNQNTQWTRNRLRHELLPLLRERFNTKADAALARLATQADEAQQLIERLASKVARDSVVADIAAARIDCEKLAGEPSIIVREVLRFAWRQAGWPEQSMGFNQWQQLADLASGTSSQPINLPGNIQARREKQSVILSQLAG